MHVSIDISWGKKKKRGRVNDSQIVTAMIDVAPLDANVEASLTLPYMYMYVYIFICTLYR